MEGESWGAVRTVAEATRDGLSLQFSSAIDASSLDPDAFWVEQWNYRWSPEYGSDHWSVDNPDEEDHDEREVTDVVLRDDGRRLDLVIPDLKPADTTRLVLELEAANGVSVEETVYFTIYAQTLGP